MPIRATLVQMTALLTDLYELNMAASYWRRSMNDQATFSLFVRRLPAGRGFLVAAGIESCLDYLEGMKFEDDDLRYMREVLGFSQADVERFRRFRFTGDIWAVPEGRIVFAGEPLVEVSAPLPEAQLIETLLLNKITFETTIASKAARSVVAAKGRDVIDFSFRRTQGIEAAMEVAKLSAMVGFVGTSNVEAAKRYGLSAAGTMAHSYIEAFPTEAGAFKAFAQDFPGRPTFLVDTYDTLAGVQHAADVIKELGLRGRLGIRLDSGDLAELAKQSRRLLDRAGLAGVRIIASGGLDELQIEALVRERAPIDAFGVGTKMGVSADHPYLDTAYKLVWYAGRAVMKLSRGKVTAPGSKQIFRRVRPFGDLVGLRDEALPAGRERLLELVMTGGRRVGGRPALARSRARFELDLAALPPPARSLRSPKSPAVLISPRLRRLSASTRRELVTGRGT